MATTSSPKILTEICVNSTEMESRFLKAFILLIVLFLCRSLRPANSEIVSCDKNETCGYNSLCINKECVCNEGFINLVEPVGEKGKNCVDRKCENGRCYTCIDNTRCKRCVRIVTERTGKCTDECKTEVVLKLTGEYVGDVCKAPKESEWTKEQLIGLIVGLCVAAVLIIVVGVIIVIIRKKKSDQETNRQIEEIRARKKKEKEERRARRAARNGNTPEGNQGAIPADKGNESSGNNQGAKDFEV